LLDCELDWTCGLSSGGYPDREQATPSSTVLTQSETYLSSQALQNVPSPMFQPHIELNKQPQVPHSTARMAMASKDKC